MARELWKMAIHDVYEERAERGLWPFIREDLAHALDMKPPARAYAIAERYVGRVEQHAGTNEYALVHAAGNGEYSSIAETFGAYLAHMVCGSGLSWFDDHEPFEVNGKLWEAPLCDAGEASGDLARYALRALRKARAL